MAATIHLTIVNRYIIRVLLIHNTTNPDIMNVMILFKNLFVVKLHTAI